MNTKPDCNMPVIKSVGFEKKSSLCIDKEKIGPLITSIVHGLNNILAEITGSVETAQLDVPLDDSLQETFSQILNASYRATDLVNQLLSIIIPDGKQKKQVSVNRIVKETLDNIRASLPGTIEIRSKISLQSTFLLADPEHFRQVLMSLYINAGQAMAEKGGKLEVSLTDVNLDSKDFANYSNIKAGPYLKITVSDTGHGMGSSTKERIFEPYFTTREKSEGFGMGLFVARGIIESYGGIIDAHSEPGKGAIFNIFLPTEEKKQRHENKTSGGVPVGKERILYIDDEKILAQVGKSVLKKLGYHVDSRTDSVEALQAFRMNPDKFDLVITDMTMPNMSGDMLARGIMQIRADIPIILCTGYSDRMNEEKARSIGIRHFLKNPFAIHDLARTIRSVLTQ